jgi:hypothetical protein
MKPMERDLVAATAALAHGDCWPVDKAAALVHGTSQRTQHRWRKEGRGSPLDGFGVYLYTCPSPYRLEAWVRVTVKQLHLRTHTTASLIARYTELLETMHQLIGETNVNQVRRWVSWKERAHGRERLAAITAELAAVERIFEERRVSDSEVLRG